MATGELINTYKTFKFKLKYCPFLFQTYPFWFNIIHNLIEQFFFHTEPGSIRPARPIYALD